LAKSTVSLPATNMFFSFCLGLLLTSAVTIYKFIVSPAFLSPLAKIPNAHWSCSFSSIWILWMRWTQRENQEVYRHHMAKGVVVRLGPQLLSVNCFEDGLKTIYGGGFPKPSWYFHAFAVYG
jgi:hypothetical protein